MKKTFITLAAFAALFAALPAIADSDDGGGNSPSTEGSFAEGSAVPTASTQGGFGSGF